MPVTLNPETWINWPMVREPLNWVIVGVAASISLLAIHCVMAGFGAMQGNAQASIGGGGPGTIAAPLATTGTFSQPGSDPATGDALNMWFGTGPTWTDSYDARYAEDGWIGNS